MWMGIQNSESRRRKKTKKLGIQSDPSHGLWGTQDTQSMWLLRITKYYIPGTLHGICTRQKRDQKQQSNVGLKKKVQASENTRDVLSKFPQKCNLFWKTK